MRERAEMLRGGFNVEVRWWSAWFSGSLATYVRHENQNRTVIGLQNLRTGIYLTTLCSIKAYKTDKENSDLDCKHICVTERLRFNVRNRIIAPLSHLFRTTYAHKELRTLPRETSSSLAGHLRFAFVSNPASVHYTFETSSWSEIIWKLRLYITIRL